MFFDHTNVHNHRPLRYHAKTRCVVDTSIDFGTYSFRKMIGIYSQKINDTWHGTTEPSKRRDVVSFCSSKTLWNCQRYSTPVTTHASLRGCSIVIGNGFALDPANRCIDYAFSCRSVETFTRNTYYLLAVDSYCRHYFVLYRDNCFPT